jgi:hypothetical protein
MKQATMKRIPNKIESVIIRRIVDESPDTSYLGEYSNKPTSEFSIDRAHSLDCASVLTDIKEAKQTLEHVQQTIGDLYNGILAQYNGTLANEKLDAEKNALDEAYDMVGELIDSVDECDCGERGDMERGEYRYFNPSFNYVSSMGKIQDGLTPEDVRKYTLQDYERMERANRGDWCMVGVKAVAEISIPSTSIYHSSTLQTIHSGGLWGIESDSDKAYFAEVEKDELADLRTQLRALGFSTRALTAAFQNVEHKEE